MSTHNWKSFFFRLTVVISIEIAFSFFAVIPTIEDMNRYTDWSFTFGAVVTIVVSIWILYFGIRWSYKGLIHKSKE